MSEPPSSASLPAYQPTKSHSARGHRRNPSYQPVTYSPVPASRIRTRSTDSLSTPPCSRTTSADSLLGPTRGKSTVETDHHKSNDSLSSTKHYRTAPPLPGTELHKSNDSLSSAKHYRTAPPLPDTELHKSNDSLSSAKHYRAAPMPPVAEHHKSADSLLTPSRTRRKRTISEQQTGSADSLLGSPGGSRPHMQHQRSAPPLPPRSPIKPTSPLPPPASLHRRKRPSKPRPRSRSMEHLYCSYESELDGSADSLLAPPGGNNLNKLPLQHQRSAPLLPPSPTSPLPPTNTTSLQRRPQRPQKGLHRPRSRSLDNLLVSPPRSRRKPSTITKSADNLVAKSPLKSRSSTPPSSLPHRKRPTPGAITPTPPKSRNPFKRANLAVTMGFRKPRSHVVEMVNVKDMVEGIENKTPEKGYKKRTSKCWKYRCFLEPCKWFLSSRFVGLLLGPVFGLIFYYYITFLILNGPPFTPSAQSLQQSQTVGAENVGVVGLENSTDGSTSNSTYAAPSTSETIPNSTDAKEDVPLMTVHTSHVIGGTVGCGIAIVMAVGGFYSEKWRCAMLLMIPSLFAKRGRAFILAAAAGLLLTGPVETISHNIQEISDGLTCMYDKVKDIGELYVEQYGGMWNGIQGVFEKVNQMIDANQRALTELAKRATEDVRKSAQAAKEAVDRQAAQLKEDLKTLKKVFTPPVKAVNWLCKAGGSIRNVIKAGWNEFRDLFWGDDDEESDETVITTTEKKKKKKDCIKHIVPNVNIPGPDINLQAMKDFIHKLDPNMNLIDFTWDDVFGKLEHSSIKEIREKLFNLLQSIFAPIQKYSRYLAKLLYLSIFFLIRDAIKYMREYYRDDSYDNMFVDDNLRRLWWNGDKEKLLPLRSWELKMKYQYSSALKLSKAEAKRILIQSIPSMLFGIASISIILVDFALSSLLKAFRDNAQFGISFPGMEQGVMINSLLPEIEAGEVDPQSLGIEGFDLRTNECLPTARWTRPGQTAAILTLTIMCLISCVFDAYASRLRAKICNLSFPTRATQRGEYLYRRLQTGRVVRKIQFNMIVCRELDMRERSAEFWSYSLPPISRLWRRKPKPIECAGCLGKIPKGADKPYAVTHKDARVEAIICWECQKDQTAGLAF